MPPAASEKPPVVQDRRHGSRRRTGATSTTLRATLRAPSPSQRSDSAVLSAKSAQHNPWVRTAFFGLGVLWLAYLISLLVRNPSQQWTWLDGWGVVGFELTASLLCLYRWRTLRTGHSVSLLLAIALLCWTFGDALLTIESLGGKTPPVPSGVDVFYLLFYPVAYVATVLSLQKGLGRLSRPNWLDGLVAGLGAAALCAAFAFHSIHHITGGTSLATAVNLAYPIGDLLLLLLVIGGTVLLAGRRTAQWYILATGLSVIVLGDTFNLFSSSGLATRLGSDFNDIAWPTAILLIAISVWLPPKPVDPLREEKASTFLLPGLAAFGGFFILMMNTISPISRVALWLSGATLFTVGVRLAISARSLRILTELRNYEAHTDELMSLGNRRQLSKILDLFFEGQDNTPDALRELAFLFVDLNRFKEINDSFGHPAGDELLRQLGPRLIKAVGLSGTVIRLGGDELAIVLLDADADAAADVANKIIEEIEQPFVLNKIRANIGASIGIALVPSNAIDATTLMWCADVAMYRAKLGGIPYVFYDQDLDGAETQAVLLDELQDALNSGSLALHYQPLLDLKTGQIMSVEALVRWPHPQHGLVPPDKFLPLARESGLMWPLTQWVLNEALGQCASWRAAGRELAVSVNVATTDLLEAGFFDLVQELLNKYDLPGDAVVIEITEESIINDFTKTQGVIRALCDAGIVVSIDDFGAGFTSLAYLSSLAVGELKLDRAFITALNGEAGTRETEIVRATINLGHGMGLRVVAEGIEDKETLALIEDLGCDIAQGYFISRPSPPSRLSFHAGDVVVR